jgi:hypothetical protein
MEIQMEPALLEFAKKLASAYAALDQVRAVGLGGSRAGAFGPDDLSDIDLYVYQDGEIPLAARRLIASSNSSEIEIGNRFWEEGDEWTAREPPVKVDVMFRDPTWIEDEVARALERHEARLGYSTCFLYNVQTCRVLSDRRDWLSRLKERSNQPYPLPLRDAIIAKNHPVLRNSHSAYARQIESASRRNDLVSLNHRVAAFLASYFDIIIAVNLKAHPGEKRLLSFLKEQCSLKPENAAKDVEALLAAAPGGGAAVIARVTTLLDGLDDWLGRLGLLPAWPAR